MIEFQANDATSFLRRYGKNNSKYEKYVQNDVYLLLYFHDLNYLQWISKRETWF